MILALVVMIMIKMHVVLVVASLAVGAKNAVATIVLQLQCVQDRVLEITKV